MSHMTSDEEEIRSAFRFFDSDSSGALDLGEFHAVMVARTNGEQAVARARTNGGSYT